MTTRVIALSNQKGGVGKTTIAQELATALGLHGHRTLVIDFCPGFHLTRRFSVVPSTLAATALEVATGTAELADSIVRDVAPGVDLLAGSRNLAALQMTLISQLEREKVLFHALEDRLGEWEYVLIDTPPNLDLLTVNALYAADGVIVPIVMLEEGSLQGAAEAIATVRKIAEIRRLEVLGVLRTCVDHRSIGYAELNPALGQLGVPIVETEIPDTRVFSNAARERRPLLIARPNHPGAIAYRDLAVELVNGIGSKPDTQKAVA
jgi:chromosome partitioning protein